MNDLRPYYLSSLKGYRAALQAAVQAASGGSEEARESISRIAHRLRGSAGSFGFGEITEAAARAEDAAEHLLPRTADLLSEIDAALLRSTAPTLTILAIDDDPDVIRLLSEVLAGPHRLVHRATSAEEALERTDQTDYDLILLDLVLPEMSGQDLLTALRSRPRTAETPIFVLSAVESEATRAECFALGADSYFVKPIAAQTLVAAVSHFLERAGVRQRASRVDVLTDLPNRVAAEEEFGRMAALAARDQRPLCLAVLDLDHFKHVNDTHGHAAGDRVLRTVAQRLAARLRRSDLLCRWGGEEFVLLLNGTTAAAAGEILTQFQEHVSSEPIPLPNGGSVHVGFSGGVAEVKPGDDLVTAFEAADAAMFVAKSAGRGRLVLADAKIPARPQILVLEDEPSIAAALRRHLERQGFSVLPAASIADARAHLDLHKPALALLDIDVPDGSGLQLLSELRTAGSFLPIMMVTARTEGAEVALALDLGADDYLRKPFDPVELTARMRRLLRRR